MYSMVVLNETELYAPVKKLPEEQGYTVRREYFHCDLVAVRGGEPPVIVYLSASTPLCPSSTKGSSASASQDAVYLAVAAPTGRKAWAIWNRKCGAVLQLCRRLGLGLMTLDAHDPRAPNMRRERRPHPAAEC